MKVPPAVDYANTAQTFSRPSDGKSLRSARHPTSIEAAVRMLYDRGLGANVCSGESGSTIAWIGDNRTGARVFGKGQEHEIGNWLIDTARTAYPDRDWNCEEPSPDLNPAALEIATIQLPALEIEWAVQVNSAEDREIYGGDFRVEARHKRNDQIQFGLTIPFESGNDIEEICRRLRAALEAAVHTYRSPKT